MKQKCYHKGTELDQAEKDLIQEEEEDHACKSKEAGK